MKYRQAVQKLKKAGWEKIRKGATSHSIWQRGSERLIFAEHDPLGKKTLIDIRRAIAQ